MSKIIGNTTATPTPQPDWNQNETNKADYIKNKPQILTEEDVIQIIEENGGAGGGGNLDSKLDKNTEGGSFRVYAIDPNGEQTVLGVATTENPNALVRRDQNGSISIRENPTKDNEAVSKKYVDDQVANAGGTGGGGGENKVDKVSEVNRVYGTSAEGKQTTYPVNLSAIADSVVLRGDNGVVKVGKPVDNTDAVNKQYLAGELSNKISKAITSFPALYGCNSETSNNLVAIADTPNRMTGNCVPLYFTSMTNGDTAPPENKGYLITQTPAQNYHAANKKYVDEKAKSISDDTETKITETNGAITSLSDDLHNNYTDNDNFESKMNDHPAQLASLSNVLGSSGINVPLSSQGTWSSISTDVAASPLSLVVRDSNGRTEIESPINDSDAANKKYVDDTIMDYATSNSNYLQETLRAFETYLDVDGKVATKTSVIFNGEHVETFDADTKVSKMTNTDNVYRVYCHYGTSDSKKTIATSPSLAVDDGNGNLAVYGIPARSSSTTITGHLMTGDPKYDYDAANKKYVDDNFISKSGDTITGDLSITGDLTVQGIAHIQDSETSYIASNILELNPTKIDNSTVLSGIAINKDANSTYGVMYDPSDDTVKFGEGTTNAGVFSFNVGEGAPLAVRDDSDDIADGAIMIFDKSKNKLVDSGYTIDTFKQWVRNYVESYMSTEQTIENGVLSIRTSENNISEVNGTLMIGG